MLIYFLLLAKIIIGFLSHQAIGSNLIKLTKKGYIKTIDQIDKELRPREKEELKDDIQLWYENNFNGKVISIHKQEIVNKFTEINQFIYDNPKYNDSAYDEWFRRPDVADPWLIATAKAYNYTLVTFEIPI